MVLMLLLAAAAMTSAQAAERPLPADMLGRWCFVSHMHIGDGKDGGPTYSKTYSRDAADCANTVITVEIGPHSLDGLLWSLEDGQLYVEGSPKPAKGKR